MAPRLREYPYFRGDGLLSQKALGNSKADVLRMIEAQPELAMQLRRVRGGYLKIQGTWLPFDVALRLARRVAWPIRDDLIPLFGPTFPDSCLSPDQPGFGQPIENLQKRKHRRAHLNATTASASGSHPAGAGGQPLGPDRIYKPYAPTSPPGMDSPPHGRRPDRTHFACTEDTSPTSTPSASYSALPNDYERAAADLGRRGSVSHGRQRFAPYPATSPTQDTGSPSHHHSSSPAPVPQGSRHPQTPTQARDLPSISTFLPRPKSSSSSGSVTLPRIGSIRDMIQRPELDASTVLKRLKLDDEQSKTGRRSPMGWSEDDGTMAPWDAASRIYQQRLPPESERLISSPGHSPRMASASRRPSSPFTRPFAGHQNGRSTPGVAVPQYRPGDDGSGRSGYLDRLR
ncbi:hypothetical protein FRB96_005620 [Tulasnella sp. 330]|nr:hypothetical protein FRB96_005620 [Tulasnella sp. 330]KAG8890752.1 hypothetical protein FRB98_004797 [Tulasnella sp. 332]